MINTKPLIKFLLWTFTLFLICIIGASNVLAETISNMTFSQFRTSIGSYSINSNQYIYDTVSVPVQMGVNTNGFSWEWISSYTSNCSGQTIISGQLAIPNENLNYDWLDDNIKKIYYVPYLNYNGEQTLCTWSVNPDNNIVSFTCSTSEPHDNFIIGGTFQYRINTNFNTNFRIYRTFNITCDNSASAIIDNQSQNTQNIINNNNTNTQDIINNNDENTNKIIDENKKNFQDCRDSYNLLNVNASSSTINGITFTVNEDKSITINGTNTGSTSWFRLAPNFVLPSGTYTLSNGNTNVSNNTFIFVDDGSHFDRLNVSTKTFNSDVTISPYIKVASGVTINNQTIYPMIQKGNTATDYEEYGKEVCTNKLDETKDAINDVDSTLKDDSVDDNGVADAFDSFNDFLDDNSTITQLITLPITLYTAILNNLNGTCSPFNLGQLYGENLILPCINISQYLGTSLWTMIDIIISGFAVYAISKKMIKVFNNFSSLREGDVIDD